MVTQTMLAPLAVRTEVCAAAGGDNALNGVATAGAGFALATVYSEESLKGTRGAAGILIVADSSATTGNPRSQNSTDSPVKFTALFFGKGRNAAAGVNSAAKETFIGIDIAHAGDKALV